MVCGSSAARIDSGLWRAMFIETNGLYYSSFSYCVVQPNKVIHFATSVIGVLTAGLCQVIVASQLASCHSDVLLSLTNNANYFDVVNIF